MRTLLLALLLSGCATYQAHTVTQVEAECDRVCIPYDGHLERIETGESRYSPVTWQCRCQDGWIVQLGCGDE